MVEKTFVFEADSVEAAREKAKVYLAGRGRVISENVTSGSHPEKIKAVARSTQAAFDEAIKQIPPGSRILQKQEITSPETRTATIFAYDEHHARKETEAQAGENAIIQKTRLIAAGKKGFLGIGKKPNQYQVEWLQQAVVDLTFQPIAKISFQVEWNYTTGLRPLGNKRRLAHTNRPDDFDVRLLLFRDQASAEKYYSAFLSYAEETPPPYLMEVLLIFIPKTIFAEKYAITLPNEHAETRPGYEEWLRNAVWSCNEILRIHNHTDHKYQELHHYAEAVLMWDIITPGNFSDVAQEASALLCDDPDNEFPSLKILGQENTLQPPEMPKPQGPWIGILFEIASFDEALYGRAATNCLMRIVGKSNLANCVIHGGDLLPEARYWCTAIHTDSDEQARTIEQLFAKSDDHHLALSDFRMANNAKISLSALPYQGFVNKNGVYVGI